MLDYKLKETKTDRISMHNRGALYGVVSVWHPGVFKQIALVVGIIPSKRISTVMVL